MQNWNVVFWCYDSRFKQFSRVTESTAAVCNDSVEAVKSLLGTALETHPSRLALFFLPPTEIKDSEALNVSLVQDGVFVGPPIVGVEVRLSQVIFLVDHLKGGEEGIFEDDPFQLQSNAAQMVVFERGKLLCELPSFNRNVLVIILPTFECSLEKCACAKITANAWPRFSKKSGAIQAKGPFTLKPALQQERQLNVTALNLRDTPDNWGHIAEDINVPQCIIEFDDGGDNSLPPIIPEYVFNRLVLSPSIPFSMCRSLLADRPCCIRIWSNHTDDGNERGPLLLQRHWAFKSLRCQNSIRPTGIRFAVLLDQPSEVAFVEWLPSGSFRVTLEHKIEIGEIPVDLEHILLQKAEAGLDRFLKMIHAPVKLPSSCQSGQFRRRVVDFMVNYNAFASVIDVRRLVDDEIRRFFFVEQPQRKEQTNEDQQVPQSHPLALISSEDHKPRKTGRRGRRKKNGETTTRGDTSVVKDNYVSLMYAPLSTREYLQSQLFVYCKIIRSSANGVLCRIRLRASTGQSVPIAFVMSASIMMRLSVVRSLPREFEQPRSAMSLQHVDPQLHSSVRNSGLSRKIWKFGNDSTNCVRHRNPVPLNVQNDRDMQRYNRAEESHWIMEYRGVCYAAIDDENQNGDVIRRLREEHLKTDSSSKKPKRNLTGGGQSIYPKELRFYNAPVLKEITEGKYRTLGFDAEEFRFFPACIRYRGKGTLPARCLAVMAPLFRRGLLKFHGRSADDIEEQLRAFNRAPTNTSTNYVIKANKTLGAGDFGELPEGPVADWGRHTKVKLLRQGVHRDQDRRFSAYHALLCATQHPDYINLAPAAAEKYVRKHWKLLVQTFLDEAIGSHQMTGDNNIIPERMIMDTNVLHTDFGISTFNNAICEMWSLTEQCNIVVFYYSYTSSENVEVTFVGKRYRPCLVNGSHYEPIIRHNNDDDDNDDDSIPKDHIAKLFKAFYPERDQHYQRVNQIGELVGNSNIKQLVCPKRLVQIAIVLERNGDVVALPVVQGPVDLDLPVYESSHPLIYSVDVNESSSGIFRLRALLETIVFICGQVQDGAYLPRVGLLGLDGMVHAMVLQDARLICPFEKGVEPALLLKWCQPFREHFVIVENTSLKTPFMGIRGSITQMNTESHLALTGGVSVKQCFMRILSYIQEWVVNGAASKLFAEIISMRSYETRRAALQEKIVEPILQIAKSYNLIPLPIEVMRTMVLSYLDHHPQPETWTLLSRVQQQAQRTKDDSTENVRTTTVTSTNSNSGGILVFESPVAYLKWLARQE